MGKVAAVLQDLQRKASRCEATEKCWITDLFERICTVTTSAGIGYYHNDSPWHRTVSTSVVVFSVIINVYACFYITFITINHPINRETIATSLGLLTFSIQATVSTVFLAYWQCHKLPSKLIEQLHSAHRGVGMRQFRGRMRTLSRSMYFILGFILIWFLRNLYRDCVGEDVFIRDPAIPFMFGDRRLFIVYQMAHLHSFLCWAIALFVYSILTHAANAELVYFNGQMQELSLEAPTDSLLCDRIVQMMQVHKALIDCVKRLDGIFNRYAFIMMTTIIPLTIFSFLIFIRASHTGQGLFCTLPIVLFSLFCFASLINAPSELHETIYSTKAALCSNTSVWFPYRPNVYHSALAFACHLDQANLGISIWGFAVVSKPLVLTVLSVMATCLALFLQLGDCTLAT